MPKCSTLVRGGPPKLGGIGGVAIGFEDEAEARLVEGESDSYRRTRSISEILEP